MKQSTARIAEKEFDATHQQGRRSASWLLYGVVAFVSAGLATASQTISYFPDEGYHLLAARLIGAGRKPYLDFFYPQTPLYAYLNAAWMWLFGESWRSSHALSALLTAAGILIVATFVFDHLRDPDWRLSLAINATLLVGLSYTVVKFGTISQPYALCMFLILTSFRLMTKAVALQDGYWSAAAGLSAGAAASSSLLSAPVGPIMLLWMLRYNRIGSRLRKSVYFLGGLAAAFLPVLWLAVQAPRQTLFNIFGFQLVHRTAGFRDGGGSPPLKFDILTSWLDSSQALIPILLALVGLLFLIRQNKCDPQQREELLLCVWLISGLGAWLAIPQPTYPVYFILVVPFLAILASAGLYVIGSRIWAPASPGVLVILVAGLFSLGLARAAYHDRFYIRHYNWRHVEEIVQEVNRVTPAAGLVYTSEASIYFAVGQTHLPGLGVFGAHDISLPDQLSSSLHLLSRAKLRDWLAEGRFSTVLVGGFDPMRYSRHPDDMNTMKRIQQLYRELKSINGCQIFWNRIPRPQDVQ